MKLNHVLRAVVLMLFVVSVLPVNTVNADAVSPAPPPDMFQLPWEQGVAWMAIDGLDNGTKRPLSSSHHYTVGGAIDFAPRKKMIKGEDTTNFWVTAAASGTVIGLSKCHVILAHENGWVTQYQFLGNVQVYLGDSVERNQRLGIIADGVHYKFCPGSIDPDIPHLHFMLRPTMVDATFAGWTVNYNSFFNITSFTKNGRTVGLYNLLLNTFDDVSTPTPTVSPTSPSPTATTPTPTGPHSSTTVDQPNINVGETTLVTVSLNNVPPEGYTSAEFTCMYDPVILEVSNVNVTNLFGPDPAVAVSGPQNGKLIVAIAGSHGNKATTSGPAFTFNIKGLQSGQTVIDCKVRVSTGNGQLMDLPSVGAVVTVSGYAPTPTSTFTIVPSIEPTQSATPTPPSDIWLTFTNQTYGFLFQYPPQGSIADGGNDNFTRIDLPFTPGTNLTSKYLEMVVVENVNPCQSPLASQSILQTTETVIINGLSFLKQTGEDGTTGHINKWTAYSISRDNACVSLDFILRSANPGVFVTPPPLYDETAESAVFGQMVSTFAWLTQQPTPTQQTLENGILTGQVFASKPVIVTVYDLGGSTIGSVTTDINGSFSFALPAGTYTTVASLNGFLSAQTSILVNGGATTALPSVNLPAGDIDGNNIIDQFDALTIGMNYNAAQPTAADLNNDGIINVLDLERLAANYRKTGPIVWQ